MDRNSNMLPGALSYAGAGWPVIPLEPGGKRPLLKNWPNQASTDPRRISEWWSRWPHANIGILTGPQSGLLAVDVDDVPGLEALQKENGPLPATRTHATGSGGIHYLFRYPANVEIRNSAGKLARGLDVRGAGGFIVVPPSATTRAYELVNDLPLAEPPAWLLERLRTPERAAPATEPAPRESPAPIQPGESIPAGRRNLELFHIACRGRARGLERPEIAAELARVNRERCAPPLGLSEIERIAASAARYPAGGASADGTPATDAETLAALELITARLERREWRGMAGKSDRDVFIALLNHARRHGRLIPTGVRVGYGTRALALAAGVSHPTALEAISRLRQTGLLRKDDANRSGTQAGAFVLVLPHAGRASLYHSDHSLLGGLVVKTCAPPHGPPPPRLRWSAPDERRLGKTAGAVVDALEAAGGELPLAELAARVKSKRPRDLKRRALARLEAAGVVACSGATVALARDWLDALERERENAGEIAAHHRDLARYEREQELFRNRTNPLAAATEHPRDISGWHEIPAPTPPPPAPAPAG